MEKQHRIRYMSAGIPLWNSQGDVMDLQLSKRLSTAKTETANHKIRFRLLLCYNAGYKQECQQRRNKDTPREHPRRRNAHAYFKVSYGIHLVWEGRSTRNDAPPAVIQAGCRGLLFVQRYCRRSNNEAS